MSFLSCEEMLAAASSQKISLSDIFIFYNRDLFQLATDGSIAVSQIEINIITDLLVCPNRDHSGVRRSRYRGADLALDHIGGIDFVLVQGREVGRGVHAVAKNDISGHRPGELVCVCEIENQRFADSGTGFRHGIIACQGAI